MKSIVIFVLFFVVSPALRAQELFPVAEPASTVPKGALGVRLFDEGYKESGLVRDLAACRLMYGITPRLSLYGTVTASDFHEKTLPFDFISHNHGGQTFGGANTPAQGVAYPLIYNSVDLYAKYRFVSSDGQNTHFRMAAYAEASKVSPPSHEAEPDLLIHTSGFGAGLIATWLRQRFAGSLSSGFILPLAYSGDAYDRYGGIYPTTITYGNALTYSLSLGYRLLPASYTGYRQTNWNVYIEFTGKAYGAAQVSQKDGPAANALPIPITINTPILQAGSYLDVIPGIQCILSSTYRIDFSTALPLVNKSYDHLYPFVLVGIQRYFFFSNSGKSDKLAP